MQFYQARIIRRIKVNSLDVEYWTGYKWSNDKGDAELYDNRDAKVWLARLVNEPDINWSISIFFVDGGMVIR